jgi:hypothetical protein
MQTKPAQDLTFPQDQAHPAIKTTNRSAVIVFAAFIVLTALAVSVYLLASSAVYSIGFPLDDAWIHQTYARNLALYGQWAFVPGQPSAGSTAPLWSGLLSLGYLLQIPHFFWSFLLGSLSLLGMALVGQAFFGRCLPGYKSVVPWAGFFLIGEWHFAWAAVSGMETLLTGLVFLLVLLLISQARKKTWAVAGALIGLSIWLRPDGITLLGPAVLVLVLVEDGWRSRMSGLAWLFSGLLLFFIPYLLFNLLVQGSIWPNTFYAKQAEYAELRQIPLLTRFFSQVSLPLIGSGLFLLPGFTALIWRAWKARQWAVLAAVIWFFGYALVYALRLPVTYQYGRYFMPAMAVYFIIGVAGSVLLVERLPARRWPWLFTRVWLLSLIGIWLGFFVIGATRYAQDVAIIQTEMVAAANWVAANTPPDAVIAAHDIGALGYFANRPLIDLAGLVSPEVIPFIRDEAQIAVWLDTLQVDYLVVFKDWYLHLPLDKQPVFQTEGQFSPQSGGDSMVVYRWLP